MSQSSLGGQSWGGVLTQQARTVDMKSRSEGGETAGQNNSRTAELGVTRFGEDIERRNVCGFSDLFLDASSTYIDRASSLMF